MTNSRERNRAWRSSARLIAAAALPLLLTVAAAPAAAQIYKCVGPDGKTSYTGDRSQCVAAQEHELQKEIQIEPQVNRTGSMAARGRAPQRSRPAALAGAPSGGEEAMWRRKQSEAKKKLEEVTRLHLRRQKMVKACNRGSNWWGTDESGIRRHLSCDDLKRELAELAQERKKLEAYLGGGLRDECRRAGCLPGWLR